jgi:hypothetical protein
MKETLIAGDTLDFSTTVTNYPASDGYTLKYRLVPRVAGTPIDLTATTDTDGVSYRVQASPIVTSSWTAGEYDWFSWVEKVGARYSVGNGQTVIQPNPAVASTSDRRSHAQKTLDAIEAVIEGRASLDQQEYTIGNRQLKRTPLADLMELRKYYQSLVKADETTAALNGGRPVPNRFSARL